MPVTTASKVKGFVGSPIERKEDRPHLLGTARFVADLGGDAATVRFVRSPIAAGKIKSIQRPPAVRVYTGADMGDIGAITPILGRGDFVPIRQEILPTGEVRFTGEPVAAVVGANPAEAEDLADQVRVEIEPEQAVVSIEDALKGGVRRVHKEAPNNTCFDGRFESPAFTEAAARGVNRVEVDIVSHRESHLPLEGRGGFAEYDPRSGRVTLYASVQGPHMARTLIADVLRIRESQLRVVAPDVGGGFGQKLCPGPEYIALVWLARHLEQSLQWIEDRRENFLAAGHGRDNRYSLRGHFDADAKLVALDAEMVANAGAYGWYPVTAALEAIMSLTELPGPYDIQGYRVRARAVTTNTCPSGTYRGIARPNITLSLERLMDIAARRLAITPLEIRERNLIRSFPHLSPTGLEYDTGSYVESVREAARTIDIRSFRIQQLEERSRGVHLGLGLSSYSERTGYGSSAFANRGMALVMGYENVEMTMGAGGEVVAKIGASPHGQGLETTLSQIVADELGLTPEDISVVHSDTDKTPFGWGSFASRGIVIAGGACLRAAQELGDRVRSVARLMLDTEEPLELRDGHVVSLDGSQRLSIQEVARAASFRAAEIGGGIEPGLKSSGSYDPKGTFSNACHAAIVSVDAETGMVTIKRYVAVEDAGRLINPMVANGQIRGGIAQGIAGALYEEIVYDDNGNLLTSSLMDYVVPSATEIPEVEIVHLESVSDATITGAKGLGEGGTIGAPAAILNAISDALQPWGVEINETPATPERVRAAIRDADLSTDREGKS